MAVESVLFVLGKHPEVASAGDVVITRLLMGIASAGYRVRAIALDSERASTDNVLVIEKPPIGIPQLVLDSLRSRKSLIHTRFNLANLASAIQHSSDADRLIAEHSYMAESVISASPSLARSRLIVNTHVSEADVLQGTRRRNPIAYVEAARTRRDERRVAQSARTVAVFDSAELDWYRSIAPNRHWLSLTMPPAVRVKVEQNSPILAFVGDLTWKPNIDALRPLMSAWPEISRGISGAELVLIGKGSVQAAEGTGARGLGYVDDLDAVLSGCRALIAPIAVGGGVRVKLLEAASRGLPAVATPAAVGSLGELLPFVSSAGSAEVIERARRLLLDRNFAGVESENLYSANSARWEAGVPHRVVEDVIES